MSLSALSDHPPENGAPLCSEMRCFGNSLRRIFQPRGRGADLSQRGEGSCLQLGFSEVTIITMKSTTFHEAVLNRGRGQRPNKRWQGSGAWPVRIAHGSGRDRSFQRAPRAKSFGPALILVLSEMMRAPLRRNAQTNGFWVALALVSLVWQAKLEIGTLPEHQFLQ